jgi:hypothetical protein
MEIRRPIVSVNIMGGLGNQMFQLATAFAYSKKYNGELRILKNKRFDDGRPLYWDSQLQEFTKYLTDSLPNNLSVWKEREATEYCEIPPPNPNGIYLQGYMQSSKYFIDDSIKNELMTLFSAPKISYVYIKTKFESLINNRERVVVVHARRTDYLRNEYIINFHGPLTVDYYKEAVKRMSILVKDPIFLLTSDDISFWSSISKDIPEFTQDNMFILDSENEIDTLTLLRQFQHFIIANSTFSWWAAWLANDVKKIIAPSKWFGPLGPKNYKDIYCSSWELI